MMRGKKIKDIGELALIRRLTRSLPRGAQTKVGIGDDSAVVSWNASWDLLLTSDAVLEGRHFTRNDAPEKIGHKAIGRVLSDIAAMGGEPLHVLINVVAPADLAVNFMEQIYKGASRLARHWNVGIVGGDVSQGKNVELHVFCTGRVSHGKALLRAGARVGDILYVTGALGGSLQGKHLTFAPRLREGQWLCREGWATAMLDVSDGLATDLRHMTEASGVGAVLDSQKIPRARAARRSLDRALSDGEDFELLFTVPQKKKARFEKAWARQFKIPCTPIGVMTKGKKIILNDGKGGHVVLQRRGFEHFRS